MEKLKFVNSIHEQREMNKRIMPMEGCWVECGVFTPILEKFDIKERWVCTGYEGKNNKFIEVTLDKLDHKKEEVKAKKVIEQIMEKHGELLADSFIIALINGFYNKRIDLEIFKAKLENTPEDYDKWKEMAELKESIDYTEKAIERDKAELTKLRAEHDKLKEELRENGKQNYKGHSEDTPYGQGLLS